MASIYGVQNILGNQYGRVYKKTTHETLRVEGASIALIDDFNGDAFDKPWTELDLNSATCTVPASGYWGASIGAVNENAAGGIYFADNKPFDIGKGFIFETRLAVHTAPTLTTEIQFGVMNDSYGADSQRFMLADEVAKYAMFGFYTTLGSGLTAAIRTDDGTLDSTVVSSATSVVLDAYHIFRIEFLTLASVKFYIDGARVASTTTFAMNTAATLTVQPWLMVYKHDDATTSAAGEFYVDYVKCFQLAR
jgi:hypothetical protein